MRCGASGVCGLGMRITLAPRQRRPAKDGKGLPFTGMMTRFSPTTSWQDEAQLDSLETPLSIPSPSPTRRSAGGSESQENMDRAEQIGAQSCSVPSSAARRYKY